jgi:predicted lysophospholipase L1 biosynthesis ABC-type transport system permease subunit
VPALQVPAASSRTREVAILRALGASRGWVLRDALAQSAAVLLGGTCIISREPRSEL